MVAQDKAKTTQELKYIKDANIRDSIPIEDSVHIKSDIIRGVFSRGQ